MKSKTMLKDLYEMFAEIAKNNPAKRTVFLKHSLPTTNYERINRSMRRRGVPYRIKKHEEAHKVWLILKGDD